ncbi:MAG TPA: amylo-alpha-1,6-glucosidase [Thermoanaerobaculia bacterium]|nr:amylo-alpha-1,6-glucosidase [Thermoanaerobaculia bacterium]
MRENLAAAKMSSFEKVASAKNPTLAWGPEELWDRNRKLSLEWLETDGLGGFACGTVAGARTRRHHGWYAPAIPSPRRRWMLVVGCEEFVLAGGRETGLSTQIYEDRIFPEGDRSIASFRLAPFPQWRHETPDFAVERSLCLVRDRSITIARYVNVGASELRLHVRPLLRFASVHELRRQTDDFDAGVELRGEVSWVRPVAYLPRLYLRGVSARAAVDPMWLKGFHYSDDAERGWEAVEDLWSPLAWEWTLKPGGEAYTLFSLEEVLADPTHLLDAERRRREDFTATGDGLFDELARRAEVFLADGDYRERAIISGYPSYADRGRESLVAAPGLALATGRYAATARVLNAQAAMRRNGLLPGQFAGEDGEPQYHSMDAPLWFILAVEWFARARRNASRPAPLLGAVRSIVAAMREGTRFGIRVAEDGLLEGSSPGKPLTWMNAVVDGQPVTPRDGKPVEVNALWHAALKSSARLERLAGETARARQLEAEAWHVGRRFNEAFWFSDKEYLYDVLGEHGPDASLRPNQIFAVSLTGDLLPPHRARSVYWTVRRRLLTPFGLRSLDTRDPRYHGRCEGSQRNRDLAVHQGTAWPWLMGAFIDAHFRVFGENQESRRVARAWLAPLRAHIREAGIGSISEMFDGEPPHAPRGCFAQAWSVAEVARTLLTRA